MTVVVAYVPAKGGRASLDLAAMLARSGDHEPLAVPVVAGVVEPARRTAVRVVLAVDRLRAHEVAAGAEQPQLVAAVRERDPPPASRRRP